MPLKPAPWTYDEDSQTLLAADGSVVMSFGEGGCPPDSEHMRAIAALPEVLAELQRCEWSKEEFVERFCPSCHQGQSTGHAPACTLAAALDRALVE